MITLEEKMNYLKKWFNIKTDKELIDFLINHKYKQCQEWDTFKGCIGAYWETVKEK